MVHGSSYHPPALGWKLLHLAVELTRLLLLFRSQMLPGFHAVEHALLLLRGKGREMLQPLLQLLLPFRRQTAECRITLQRAFLLPGRHISVLAEPIAGMTLHWRALSLRRSLHGRSLRWPLRILILWRRRAVVVVMLRQTGSGQGSPYSQHGRRHPACHKIRPPHVSLDSCQILARLQIGTSGCRLRICRYIVLHFQVIQ